MTVLIDPEGHKCDARCYDAKRLGCSCICGGKNHGLGLEHALKEAEKQLDEQEAEDE